MNEKLSHESTALTAPATKTLGQQARSLFNQATDVAGLCKELAKKKAIKIGKRSYVPVEVWTTIATAHGYMPTIKSVDVLKDGVTVIGIRSVAELRSIGTGEILSSAEGYVGSDESTWFGGVGTEWDQATNEERSYPIPKRADYAIRAMSQTRAISRVCRTAFAHVVVLMDVGLETVPAEEIIDVEAVREKQAGDEIEQKRKEEGTTVAQSEGKTGGKSTEVPRDESVSLEERFKNGKWKEVKIHFGTAYKGKKLGELDDGPLRGWFKWTPQPFNDKISDEDKILRTALNVAEQEYENR